MQGGEQAKVDIHGLKGVGIGLSNVSYQSPVSRCGGRSGQGEAPVEGGSVPTLDAYEQAGRVARAFIDRTSASTGDGQFAGDPDEGDTEVINLLSVGGDQQVMIEIIIAEMRKSFRHSFGMNLFGAININGENGLPPSPRERVAS